MKKIIMEVNGRTNFEKNKYRTLRARLHFTISYNKLAHRAVQRGTRDPSERLTSP